MAGMARCIEAGVVVHDVAWMRLLQWRELLAGLPGALPNPFA